MKAGIREIAAAGLVMATSLVACHSQPEATAEHETHVVAPPAVPIPFDYSFSDADVQVSLHLPDAVKAFPDLHNRLYDNGKATLDAFVEQAKKDRTPGFPEPAYYHSITWKVAAQSPRLMSLYATEDDFEGGAHPNTSFRSLIWDRRTGAVVPATKLLAAHADMSGVDVYLCRQIEAARSRREGEPVSQAASGFNCPKFAASHLILIASAQPDKIGAIDVLFAPYDVGAYAEGPYEVRVPASQFKGLISPDFADQFDGDATTGDVLPEASSAASQSAE